MVPPALHKPKGPGKALCVQCCREDAQLLPLPSSSGPCWARAGWARCPHGLWPLASLSAGQGLAATLALDLISIFITAALRKNEKVSYICVHIHVSIVTMTRHATFCCCSTQVKLHFLIGKLSYTSLEGALQRCNNCLFACQSGKEVWLLL